MIRFFDEFNQVEVAINPMYVIMVTHKDGYTLIHCAPTGAAIKVGKESYSEVIHLIDAAMSKD